MQTEIDLFRCTACRKLLTWSMQGLEQGLPDSFEGLSSSDSLGVQDISLRACFECSTWDEGFWLDMQELDCRSDEREKLLSTLRAGYVHHLFDFVSPAQIVDVEFREFLFPDEFSGQEYSDEVAIAELEAMGC